MAPSDVVLRLVRNDVSFGAIGLSGNQRRTGGGVESLGPGNAVWDAIVGLDAQAARAAFDNLSGELHATNRTAMLEDSRFVRDAAMYRLYGAFDTVPARRRPPSSRPRGRAASVRGPRARAAPRRLRWTARSAASSWARIPGRAGTRGSACWPGRRARTSMWTAALRPASLESAHLGAYVGTAWQALDLRLGAARSWHDIATLRSVSVTGIAERLSASYNARTTQVFGEIARRAGTPSLSVEPFAGLAHVRVHTEGFTETGAAAALTGSAGAGDVTFSTLGARASSALALGGTGVRARGLLGWRHAFGDTASLSELAFAGGARFAIAGLPIAKDAALVEGGLERGDLAECEVGDFVCGRAGRRAARPRLARAAGGQVLSRLGLGWVLGCFAAH